MLLMFYCLVMGHWGFFYNGNEKRDSIIEFICSTLYPWHAIELNHCTVCNSQFTDRGIYAWPPIRRWHRNCPHCGSKARPMNNEELTKLFTIY